MAVMQFRFSAGLVAVVAVPVRSPYSYCDRELVLRCPITTPSGSCVDRSVFRYHVFPGAV